MITLYSGSGSGEIQVLGPHFSDDDWAKTRQLVIRLLEGRKQLAGPRLLEKLPWTLCDGTNYFGDEFCVLYARLPIERYVEAAELEKNKAAREAAAIVVKAFGELDIFVRFVAFEPAKDSGPLPVAAPELQHTEATVSRALNDAERLLQTNGAVSAMDRMHTVIHGYLRKSVKGKASMYPMTSVPPDCGSVCGRGIPL